MAELSSQIIRDLGHLRASEAPSVAVKQRVLSAIEFQIGGGGGDGGGAANDAGSDLGHAAEAASAGGGAKLAASAGYAAKVVGATLAMTGAGLLSLKLGVAGVQAAKSKAQATDPVAAVEPAEEPTLADANLPPSEPEAAAEAPVGEAPSEEAEAEVEKPAAPRTAKTATEHTESSEPKAGVDTLALELAILDAARKASTPKAALTELERHINEYPDGQLADEREVMLVETFCALERLDEARIVAEGFLRSHPGSSLAPRIRGACPELGLQ